MVSQTRRMARSAERFAFINFQSQRHQSRSVVRNTKIFETLPGGAAPPPIPQPRTRRRRAREPDPEEGRPAKRRQRAAASIPAPAPAPAPSPSPTPPANLSPPPPTRSEYIPSPIPSPTTILPLRHSQSLNPPATPAQALQARADLSMWRYDLYGRIPNREHHEPKYTGPPKLLPSDWALPVPDLEDAEEYRDDQRDERTTSRGKDLFFKIKQTPNYWLQRRLRRKGNPENELQKARRQQLTIDKREFVKDGNILLDRDPDIYRPWYGSTLADELGWKWREGSVYTYTRPA
ncbi:hypothetical protein IFR05_003810 [Cadophora sp. M221]|nr:hypothetical protein IFR05_003810 [Cadophora sp. M221]